MDWEAGRVLYLVLLLTLLVWVARGRGLGLRGAIGALAIWGLVFLAVAGLAALLL